MRCCSPPSTDTPQRFLGLDYGDKTIGVAVSDTTCTIATGITTLLRPTKEAIRDNLKALKEIIREYNITGIALGYPLLMNGDQGERCQETLAFKDKLNRYFKSIEVFLVDERLSTQAVARVFTGKPKDMKKNIDQMAAVYILQQFLDRRNLT